MPAATTPITIPAWANGPEGSGNGGWSAGLLAERLGPEALGRGVSVSLRVPPPLERELEVVVVAEGRLELRDGDTLVAEAESPAQVRLDVEHPLRDLDPGRARAARSGYPFRDRHPFPSCVCCGTERPADAPFLDLHCGPVEDLWIPTEATELRQVHADAWSPGVELADASDATLASVAATWSALDCPSATPIADPDAEHPSVLARLTVALLRQPRIGETYAVAAWLLGVDGRKRSTASVLIDPRTRTPLAQAEALWIEVRPR